MATPLEHVVLKRIYPWDPYSQDAIEYDLWQQAVKTGYEGTLAEFKVSYGSLFSNVETYEGPYIVASIEGITQHLQTQGKILKQNIEIQPAPQVDLYNGQYEVVPMAYLDQILRTQGKTLTQDIVVEKIPYYETSNDAGGYTVIIG